MDSACIQRSQSPFGFCPVDSVELSQDGGSLEFSLARAFQTEQEKGKKVLCDLAYNGAKLVHSDDERLEVQVSRDRVRELAQDLGPLYGLDAEESLASWVEAITAAQYAVQIQLVLNGRLSPEALDGFISKTDAQRVGGGPGFTLCYCYASAKSGEYLGALAPMPKVERFGAGKYTFATLVDDGAQTYLAVAALISDVELTAADFVEAISLFTDDLSDDQFDALRLQMQDAGFDIDDESFALFVGDADYLDDELPIDKGDRELLTMLRDVFISLHVSDIEIDLFSGDDEPVVRFPYYLAYLWYEFAFDADAVRVGFCDYCGLGFNMRNWRGRTKRVCPQCKDAARNEGVKSKRDAARTLFIEEGESVEAIAGSIYPNVAKNAAEEKVRQGLASYPLLKRMLAAAPDGELSQRCKREGVIIKPRKTRSDKGVRR